MNKSEATEGVNPSISRILESDLSQAVSWIEGMQTKYQTDGSRRTTLGDLAKQKFKLLSVLEELQSISTDNRSES